MENLYNKKEVKKYVVKTENPYYDFTISTHHFEALL